MGDEEMEIKELLDETWRTCYKFLRIRAARVLVRTTITNRVIADGGDPGDLRPEPPARASEEPTAPGNLQRGSNVPLAKTSKTSKTSCRFAIERRREALVVAGENRLG